jgi:hypothetical protein
MQQAVAVDPPGMRADGTEQVALDVPALGGGEKQKVQADGRQQQPRDVPSGR